MKPPSYSYKKRDNTLSLSVITTRRHYCFSRIITRKPHSLALLSQRRQCSLSFCYSYTCILLSLSYQNAETIASLSIITKEDIKFSFSPHLSPVPVPDTMLPCCIAKGTIAPTLYGKIAPTLITTTKTLHKLSETLHQFSETMHQLSLHQLSRAPSLAHTLACERTNQSARELARTRSHVFRAIARACARSRISEQGRVLTRVFVCVYS